MDKRAHNRSGLCCPPYGPRDAAAASQTIALEEPQVGDVAGRQVGAGPTIHGLPRLRRAGVVCVRQARLEITDDLAEGTRREESRSEGAGCILADRRQQLESCSDRRGHVVKLPADFIIHSVCSVRRGETSGPRSVCGGTEGMGTHMRDGCGLSGRSSGRGRCGIRHLARGDAINEAATDPLCDVKLAA